MWKDNFLPRNAHIMRVYHHRHDVEVRRAAVIQKPGHTPEISVSGV